MFTSRVEDQGCLRVSEYSERSPNIRHALKKYRNMIDRNMRLSVLLELKLKPQSQPNRKVY